MNTKTFKTESLVWVKFKRTMYALMVIAIAIAIPLLSYMELSYNDNSEDSKHENKVKVETVAKTVMPNTVELKVKA